MKQQTLKTAFSLEGRGLHTGSHAKIKALPAKENYGIKFKILGEDGDALIPADPKYVSKTERCTLLSKNETSLSTVEHLLSAFYGMGVDNALIEVEGSEIPILDGSAKPFVEKIQSVGLEEQSVDCEVFAPSQPMQFSLGDSEIQLLPSDHFELRVMLNFHSEVLPPQVAEFDETSDYAEEIASSKTFVFLHDLLPLVEKGLVKGGALDNALVFVEKPVTDKEIDAIASALNIEKIGVGDKGLLNPDTQTFNNEPARHKLLDLIGDLALLGKRIRGKIIAYKPGHEINTAFAEDLKQKFLRFKKLKGKPDYNPEDEVVYDLEAIKAKLPHRYPFLLVDKITELSDDTVVGIKNISADQFYFQGHFPDNPVFPGVLQIEALAQTGGVLILSTVEDPRYWDTYFMKVDKFKFKNKVVPGDTIVMKMKLLSPIRRGLCHMYGTAYVGDKIVSEGELLAQIVKRDKPRES